MTLDSREWKNRQKEYDFGFVDRVHRAYADKQIAYETLNQHLGKSEGEK